jgi:hypothetical protein
VSVARLRRRGGDLFGARGPSVAQILQGYSGGVSGGIIELGGFIVASLLDSGGTCEAASTHDSKRNFGQYVLRVTKVRF